jgi:hypothetical protein
VNLVSTQGRTALERRQLRHKLNDRAQVRGFAPIGMLEYRRSAEGGLEYWPPAPLRDYRAYRPEGRAYGSERIMGFGILECWVDGPPKAEKNPMSRGGLNTSAEQSKRGCRLR